jgi:hypothetical protein
VAAALTCRAARATALAVLSTPATVEETLLRALMLPSSAVEPPLLSAVLAAAAAVYVGKSERSASTIRRTPVPSLNVSTPSAIAAFAAVAGVETAAADSVPGPAAESAKGG